MNHISSLAPGGGDMDMMAAGGMDMMGGGSTVMSVIPLWLAGFALLFSVFMGVAAGYYPANKAVNFGTGGHEIIKPAGILIISAVLWYSLNYKELLLIR